MAGPDARVRKLGPIRGDVVRVRGREEILATLDADGTLDGMPFMPEMLQFCGRELTVAARADKSCDTIEYTGDRRLHRTVHLAGARCDGSAHGGCQAGCLLFWREAWLEWPDGPGDRSPVAAIGAPAGGASVATIAAATQRTTDGGEPGYRCQATELRRASEPLRMRELGQYVNDVRSGNARLRVVIRGLLIEAFNKYQRISVRRLPPRLRIRGGRSYPFVQGTGTGERTPLLGLQPGDLVEVKSKAEIMATLGPDNRNRQLAFDAEMLPFCGRRARVQRKVTRIIDERTGKMIKLGDCVVLEDVYCMGIYHRFCPRAIPPYWREAWLRRVEEPAPAGRAAGAGRPVERGTR